MASYKRMLNRLTAMGYIKDMQLTEKGRFLTKIYANELLIGEIFFSKVHETLSVTELNIIIASINYEKRRGVRFERNSASN